jgi:hypothetical protein
VAVPVVVGLEFVVLVVLVLSAPYSLREDEADDDPDGDAVFCGTATRKSVGPLGVVRAVDKPVEAGSTLLPFAVGSVEV